MRPRWTFFRSRPRPSLAPARIVSWCCVSRARTRGDLPAHIRTELGWINAVVADDQLESEVDQWVEELCGLSPRYLEIAKISSNVWWNQARDAYTSGLGMLLQAIGSEDMLEGGSRSPRSAARSSDGPRNGNSRAEHWPHSHPDSNAATRTDGVNPIRQGGVFVQHSTTENAARARYVTATRTPRRSTPISTPSAGFSGATPSRYTGSGQSRPS